MKHADYLFHSLEDVLKQIYKFHLSHLEEFFFLDFDFDADLALSNKIADIGKTPALNIMHITNIALHPFPNSIALLEHADSVAF
jgi:hypothetical protein